MRIGIIGGTGREGRGIAVRWARAGHEVTVGSRDAARAVEKAAEFTIAAGAGGAGGAPGIASAAAHAIAGASNEGAARAADVVLLAVPYSAHASTLASLSGALAGRTLIDITVPIKPPKVTQVTLPEGGAAALEARALLDPTTRIVAALHHVSSAHLADPDHAIDCDVLVCGDDDASKKTVIALAADLGLRGLDAGPLQNAIALESLTPVLLHINRVYKTNSGVRITGLTGLADPTGE